MKYSPPRPPPSLPPLPLKPLCFLFSVVLLTTSKLPIFVVMTKSDVAGSLPPGTSSSLSPPPAPQATSPPGPPSSSSSSQEHRDRFSKNEATAVSSSLPPARDASAEMRAALQGLDRVLFSCLGRRAKIVGGVEDAEDAASALRGGGSGWVRLPPANIVIHSVFVFFFLVCCHSYERMNAFFLSSSSLLS